MVVRGDTLTTRLPTTFISPYPVAVDVLGDPIVKPLKLILSLRDMRRKIFLKRKRNIFLPSKIKKTESR